MDDREAIKELKHEYCYHLDAGNIDEFIALFTENAEIHVETPSTEFHGEGLDDVRAFIKQVTDRNHTHMGHLVTNPVITISGDTATGKWYYIKTLETTTGDINWGQGRYADEYRRVNDTWLIAKTHPIRTHAVDLN